MPKLFEARLRLGRLLYRRGELNRAAQELDAARRLASQDELRYLALVFSGMVEAARGSYEQANSFYTDALRLLPAGKWLPSPRPKRPTFVVEWAKPLPPSRRHCCRRRRTTRGGATTSGEWWHFEHRLEWIRKYVQQ